MFGIESIIGDVLVSNNPDSKQVEMIKDFVLGRFQGWINKAFRETEANCGETLQCNIKVIGLRTEQEKQYFKVVTEKTETPWEEMDPEFSKKIKLFLPSEKKFKTPKNRVIRDIQGRYEKGGFPIPTAETIIEGFRRDWEKDNPKIKDIEMLFDFQNEKIKMSITDSNGKEEIKTI